MLNFKDDPDAFRAFISEHQDRVYNLVLNKVQQKEDAEEITQDVFIDVFSKSNSFRGESTVSTWLYRIAINKCIDHLRKQNGKYKWTLTGFLSKKESINEPTEFSHPGVLAENREKTYYLFKAMNQLPERQNTAWVLSEMEQLSYKEISEIMQVSISSVESLLFRARQNLKNILAGLYPGDLNDQT